VPERYPPDDPREWLNRARSDLALAKATQEGVYLEDLCFHAQQGADKAVKALLVKLGVEFPYVHDLARLLALVEEAGTEIPEPVRQAERLTRFAIIVRYPGLAGEVNEEEYKEAISLAEEVVHWVENTLRCQGSEGRSPPNSEGKNDTR
jgi:HEPN domain-containing protein